MKQNVLNDFKNLLAYFITHLEWVENNDKDIRGFHQYLKPLLDKKIFRKTGQGYKGARIQDQIKDWESYNNGIICINIQGNYGDYTTAKCYLNWKNTGLNIRCRWENSKIISLFQEEYFYWEESKRRLPFGKEMTIEGLGLFDRSNEINDELKSFFESFEKEIIRYNQLEMDKIKIQELKPYTDLLEYKKQIILQGPPGTGKTKLAKEIAEKLIDLPSVKIKPASLTNRNITNILKDVKSVKSVAGNVDYNIVSINEEKQIVILEKSTGLHDYTYFPMIKDFYLNKSFEKSFDNNPDRRAAAIAKYIYDNIGEEVLKAKIEGSAQFKLVQFHPSYTYEDFVRGIVAKPNPNGTGILYEAENKVLGEFAKEALDNYLDSRKPIEVISKETWVKSKIKDFQKYLEEKLDKQEQIWLTKDTAYITRVTSDTIRYKGDNWKIDGGVPYNDLEKMYLANVSTLTEIRELNTLTLSAKSNTTYWQKVLELFKDYLGEQKSTLPENLSDKIQLKKYVLIIDEINRANLSSVLGELIYSLEYRGESLDGMYAIDSEGDERKNKKIILPPNLYLIGTMNTADRSVGHIDYAIRRRFAFVDVPPQLLEDNEEIWFNTPAYEAVKALFTSSNVSADFDVKDIQIGHSYFIVKKEDTKTVEEKDSLFRMKMKYEVVPILNEYVKDGILNPETKNAIEKIKETYA